MIRLNVQTFDLFDLWRLNTRDVYYIKYHVVVNCMKWNSYIVITWNYFILFDV